MFSKRGFTSLFTSILVLLSSSAPIISASSTTGTRLLVIDEDNLKDNYKAWIWDLENRGYQISYESPKSDNLTLFEHGERKWDQLVLLPPKSRAYGPKLTSQLLIQFLNQDGNILVLLSPSSVPEQLRELGRELDIGLAPRDDIVTDHFSWLPGVEGNADKQDVFLVKKPETGPKKKNYFGGFMEKEEYIAFRGTGHTLGNSPLVNPILSAPRTAYSYDSKEELIRAENPWSAGQQLHLVSGFQARNNARITFVGGADIFNDDFLGLDGLRMSSFGYKVVIGNRGFSRDVSAWTFQEIGVVKVESVKHHLAGEEPSTSENPGMYRIKNDVTFSLSLSEYSYDHWQPYTPPTEDAIQLEFTMLDPYYRLSLEQSPASATPNSSTFSTSFMVPDQHGVFAFRVNYKRPYITYIDEKHSVTVRHFAHDEYTRSWAISGAWVWIAGLAVTIVGWVAFCALWLWSAPVKQKRSVKKTQ